MVRERRERERESEREGESGEAVDGIISRHAASGSLPILSDNCILSQYSYIFIAFFL